MKMKITNFLLGVALLAGFNSFGQDDTERECTRMRFLAGEALKVQNYQEAAMYYLKGETICGGYDDANYARLIGSLRNAVNGETDKDRKTAYTDTLVAAYDREENAGFYDEGDDLIRASYILQASKPDNKKADALFVRGIAKQGTVTQEAYISYYYYNLYTLWYVAPEAEKAGLKKRLISEYFNLSKLISAGNMSVRAQENLTTYFNYVVKDCNDILPELKGFMSELSQDKEVKKATVMSFIELLEAKDCTSAPEYIQLIDTLVSIDPSSLDAQLMLAKAQTAKGNHRGAIQTLTTAKGLATDEAKKQEITYMIAAAQYSSGSYTAAYNTAMSVSGDLKSKALIIAGKSVGQNANNCGDSTFERKCNNIYAVQLLQQGGADSGTIATYKGRFPTSQDCFENGSPSSVTLSCYGVTVSPCN